jgi:hypothetical protein
MGNTSVKPHPNAHQHGEVTCTRKHGRTSKSKRRAFKNHGTRRHKHRSRRHRYTGGMIEVPTALPRV